MNDRWLVVVDVAPAAVRDAVDRILRNQGFIEVLPCVYRSHWLDPKPSRLRRTLGQARRRGVGRIGVARLDSNGLVLM